MDASRFFADLLRDVAKVTDQNKAARQAAVRWFNRLYYDFKRWTDATVASIRNDAALREDASKEDLEGLVRRLSDLASELSYYVDDRFRRARRRHQQLSAPTFHSEFCDRLEFLSARFREDFKWLLEEKPDDYYDLERLIGLAETFPGSSLTLAHNLFGTMFGILNSGIGANKPNRKRLLSALDTYEKESQKAVTGLHSVAREAGIVLLSVTEYEAALQRDGSANHQVMVVGELSLSRDTINISNVTGPVNVKSHLASVSQAVRASSAMTDSLRQQLAALIEKLGSQLGDVPDSHQMSAQRVTEAAELVSKEATRDQKDPSFVTRALDWLKAAATQVGGVAKPVLDTTERIVALVQKML